MLGHPLRFQVIPEQSGSKIVVNPNKPTGTGLVDQRFIRSPAEWVAMLDGPLVDEKACFLQSLSDKLVSIFEVNIFEGVIFDIEAAMVI